MRKAALIFVLCLGVSTILMAGPITQYQALGYAKKMAALMATETKEPQLDCKWVATENKPFYAFDIGKEKGFVLVAADDCIAPILGYSDKGHFDLGEMPPALKLWLEAFHEHLVDMGDRTISEAMSSPSMEMEQPRNAIPPLLTTTWNQLEPYNISCPDLNGEKCYSGCVATALAQLLFYHREHSVKTVQDDIEAYTCNTNWLDFGQISVPEVKKGTPIDFDHMLNHYVGGESEVEKKAVADLVFYCAASVSTEFKPPSRGGSSTTAPIIPIAMRKYFGFSVSCCYKSRSAYSIKQWEEMVYNELKERRPVFYTGESASSAHAFIIDGYDGDLCYHVNWGWGGLYDGYFNLSLLSTVEGSTANGYTMTQGALFGGQPSFDGEGLPALSAFNLSLSGSNLAYSITNYTNSDDIYKFGIAAVLNDGSLRVLKQTSSFVELPYGNTESVSLALAKSNLMGLPKGEYVIKPVFLRNSENIWRLADCSDEYGFLLKWNGATFSLSCNSPSNGRVFTAEAFSYPSNPVVGTRIPVSMTLTCKGGEYSSEVYLFASNSETTSSSDTYASKTGVYLKDGEQCEVWLYFKPSTSGDFRVWVSTDENGASSIGECEVNVSQSSEKGELSVVGYHVDNAITSGEWNTVYGKVLKGSVTLKNIGTVLFSDIITLWLMKGATKSSYDGSSSDKMLVTLAPGETMTMDFVYDEGETGHYYQLWLMKGNTLITNGKVRFFQLVPGVTIYDASGQSESVAPSSVFVVPNQACAVDLDGAGVSTIRPNNNPNTIFFIGESDNLPAGLANGNLVRAGVAENVTLVDGQVFYTPHTFHAQSISYTRTPVRQTSGRGGWETIVLPFAVQEVTNVTDNRIIDWFHSSSDSNKDFWLKEYALQDTKTGVAYFNHVESFAPHTPYIIAVPSARWGTVHDLTGKQLRFSAYDVDVTANARLLSQTSIYRFEGTYVKKTVGDVFVLNDSGSLFVRSGETVLMPFRACFSENGSYGEMANIAIGDFDVVTPINSLSGMKEDVVDVYNLSGLKVRTTQIQDGVVDTGGLPKGVYVVCGRKVVVK